MDAKQKRMAKMVCSFVGILLSVAGMLGFILAHYNFISIDLFFGLNAGMIVAYAIWFWIENASVSHERQG